MALRIDPRDDYAHAGLGVLFTQQFGDHEGAKRHLETALRINPNDGQAHTALAVVLDKCRDRTGAIRHVEAALRINPNDANALYILAMLLVQDGDHEGGRRHLDAAVRIDPNSELRGQVERMLQRASARSVAAAPAGPRYGEQLAQLRGMGFVDDAASLRALVATQGNVRAAVDRLLGD
jgi:Tfp pilus assembly protein PilF